MTIHGFVKKIVKKGFSEGHHYTMSHVCLLFCNFATFPIPHKRLRYGYDYICNPPIPCKIFIASQFWLGRNAEKTKSEREQRQGDNNLRIALPQWERHGEWPFPIWPLRNSECFASRHPQNTNALKFSLLLIFTINYYWLHHKWLLLHRSFVSRHSN